MRLEGWPPTPQPPTRKDAGGPQEENPALSYFLLQKGKLSSGLGALPVYIFTTGFCSCCLPSGPAPHTANCPLFSYCSSDRRVQHGCGCHLCCSKGFLCVRVRDRYSDCQAIPVSCALSKMKSLYQPEDPSMSEPTGLSWTIPGFLRRAARVAWRASLTSIFYSCLALI